MVGVASKKTPLRSMLEEIEIRGLGVIESARIEFQHGLNVITGETGAGKTMVLTALALISGGKSDTDLIRVGHERLQVTGRFKLPENPSENLRSLLDEHDPEVEEHSLLLSRSLTREGKSRSLLAGAATTAGALNEFSEELFEIHGQHGSTQLSKSSRQRELLDVYLARELSPLIEQYREALRNLKELKGRLDDLRASTNRDQEEINELNSLVAEFSKLKPESGELEELDERIARLENVEDLRVAAASAREVLESEEIGAISLIGTARRFLGSSKTQDPELDRIGESINEAFYALTDSSSELARYLESLEADPALLESFYDRRSALLNFAKRFGSAADRKIALQEAIERASVAQERMKDLDGGEERIAELEAKFEIDFKELTGLSQEISVIRRNGAERLDKKVVIELIDLAMPDAKFSTALTSVNPTNISHLGEYGIDDVEMRFSSHGGELLPIAKAASGGELSRLMLSLEVVIASTSPKGTYIFDEVDAGIGGKTALEVGKRLRALALNSQVVVVTHLPQVAIWADHHLVVKKDGKGAITSSSIASVDGSDREVEIARMLSGVEQSEHAQEHARELLELRKVEM